MKEAAKTRTRLTRFWLVQTKLSWRIPVTNLYRLYEFKPWFWKVSKLHELSQLKQNGVASAFHNFIAPSSSCIQSIEVSSRIVFHTSIKDKSVKENFRELTGACALRHGKMMAFMWLEMGRFWKIEMMFWRILMQIHWNCGYYMFKPRRNVRWIILRIEINLNGHSHKLNASPSQKRTSKMGRIKFLSPTCPLGNVSSWAEGICRVLTSTDCIQNACVTARKPRL